MNQGVTPRMFEWVIIIWFAVSVLTAIMSQLALYWFLQRQGVELRSFSPLFPGYLEGKYRVWARSQGQPPKNVILIKVIINANAVLAIFFFVAVVRGLADR